MLSLDEKSYFPIAMEYDVVPYNDELVKLQEQRLSKRNTASSSRLKIDVTQKENRLTTKIQNKKAVSQVVRPQVFGASLIK
jgi:hypothetical protein